jgi:hypothetical protein
LKFVHAVGKDMKHHVFLLALEKAE